METQHCILCGHITNTPFCPNCLDKARDYSEIIREYIKKNPKPALMDVYNATSIPFGIIKGLLDQGWFELIYDAKPKSARLKHL